MNFVFTFSLMFDLLRDGSPWTKPENDELFQEQSSTNTERNKKGKYFFQEIKELNLLHN